MAAGNVHEAKDRGGDAMILDEVAEVVDNVQKRFGLEPAVLRNLRKTGGSYPPPQDPLEMTTFYRSAPQNAYLLAGLQACTK